MNVRKAIEISSLIAAVPFGFTEALLPRRAQQVPVPQEIQNERIEAAKAKRAKKVAKMRGLPSC